MAKTYTFKEAKELIKKYNKLFEALISSKEYIDKYQKRIINNTLLLLKNTYFQNKELKDFKTKTISTINYEEIETLLRSMFGYFKSESYYNQCENLYNNYNSDLTENIKQLRKGQNFIKWIFSNSNRKENAESSYLYLKNMLESDFFIESNKVLNDFKLLEKIDKNELYNDIKMNELKYQGIIFEIYPDITKKGYNIVEIENISKDYASFLEQRDIYVENIENDKIKIKTELEKLIVAEMLRMLKQIPIEELNREKNGIRVKTLSDYGYKNIADIYTCSVNQIASIKGISYSAATSIKRIADKFAKDSVENAKIKLNTDNKDLISTNVVKMIYKYIKRNNCLKDIHRLIEEYKYEIEENIKKLSNVLNGVRYYFSSNEDKNKYIEAYGYLKDIVYGEAFGILIKKLFKNYIDIKDISSDMAWEDFSHNSILYYNVIEEIYPNLLENNDIYYGLPEELAKEIQEESFFPEGLLCTLRHYQEVGVKYILHQGKVLLGDEMGLGKTIQAIATMVSLRNTGATHFLVVCPASVVTNWCREISKHSKLKPTMVHGKNRDEALESWKKTGGVAVTTYETTRHIKLDSDFMYSLLIVDEAHYIKNPEAQRSMNTKELIKHADRILLMTGTALENRVDEMIGLINILNSSIAREIKNIAYLASAPKFREIIAPVYYRRKREDVLKELPDLIESREWCRMNSYEEKIYEDKVLHGSYPEVRRLSWHIDNLNYSSKAIRLKELVDEAKNENRKVIVFSFFLDTIQKISDFLGDICTNPITGAISSEKRQEIIDEFDKATPGKVLLSQIIAGGTGLNIQSASVVIICEPQFKPSIENQAISRAYRMGQSRNVLVYRLLCENTVDEKITDLLEEKQKIFDAFADKSVAAENYSPAEINEKAFGEIIKGEIDRINEKRNNIDL